MVSTHDLLAVTETIQASFCSTSLTAADGNAISALICAVVSKIADQPEWSADRQMDGLLALYR